MFRRIPAVHLLKSLDLVKSECLIRAKCNTTLSQLNLSHVTYGIFHWLSGFGPQERNLEVGIATSPHFPFTISMEIRNDHEMHVDTEEIKKRRPSLKEKKGRVDESLIQE